MFLVILSEQTVKCVIGFGRYDRILEDQWKWQKGTTLKSKGLVHFVSLIILIPW